MKRVVKIAALTIFSVLIMSLPEAFAQRDPFEKPAWARTRESRSGVRSGTTNGTNPVVSSDAPAINQRIQYYMRLREAAVANGQPVPKVTSVLTLDELAVTGIFKTPRGYAAMVEAVPIKLSYTIYPGDRFFDGQLVAVEENRLVFRKVTKMSNGKFQTSVENKPLRKYTDREVVQGTAPSGSASQDQQTATVSNDAAKEGDKKPVAIVSPLAEMERESATKNSEASSAKPKAKEKKPVKVARKKN